MRPRSSETTADPKAPVLDTPRLKLHPVRGADVAELHEALIEPSVRRYLLDGEAVERAWVEEEVRRSDRLFEERGCGLSAIRRRGEKALGGFVGFRPFFDPPELQLLYGLLPSHRGRGFATEAAASVIEHAFRSLGFERVVAATDAPNAPSIAVLERLGMRLDRRTDEGPVGTLFYSIPRPERRRR